MRYLHEPLSISSRIALEGSAVPRKAKARTVPEMVARDAAGGLSAATAAELARLLREAENQR